MRWEVGYFGWFWGESGDGGLAKEPVEACGVACRSGMGGEMVRKPSATC